jgi:hypothetical protein
MKVALSASYNDLPEVKELLQSCDLVMTTQNSPSQVENLKSIIGHRTAFCILPIGFGFGNTQLMETASVLTSTPVEDIEFVTYGELIKLREEVAPNYYEERS